VGKQVYYLFQVALVIVALLASTKWYGYRRDKKVREFVSWAVIGDYCPALGVNSYVRTLLNSVLREQAKYIDSEKYMITGSEEEANAFEIIEEFQKSVSRNYFSERIKPPRGKFRKMTKTDFFFFHLNDFLAEHECDSEFFGHDMRGERISYSPRGTTIWSGSDSTYVLTEFAIVYHKMYYIAYLYCKNSTITNPGTSKHYKEWVEESLKKTLDTNQIEISSYYM